MGPYTEQETIWDSANQLSLTLVTQQNSTTPNSKHSEQVTRFLQQELNACRRERDVLIAQLEELEGLLICPESDDLAMEPARVASETNFCDSKGSWWP